MNGQGTRTLAFHKPYDVLCTFTDPDGRPTLADFVRVPDVYAAGRLDRDSEGLMLLTGDGRLAHRVTDPDHQWPKVYLVEVERVPAERALAQLREGVRIGDVMTRPSGVRLLEDEPPLPPRSVPIRHRLTVPTAWLELTLYEGMNRQVRRMTAAVGHPTLRLVRVAIGPVRLGHLAPGEWRDLTREELDALAVMTEPGPARARRPSRTAGRRETIGPSDGRGGSRRGRGRT